jgi:hypothetical protein
MPRAKFKSISTGALETIKVVRFYESTIQHIKEEHPEVPWELPSFTDAIASAVKNPTHIEHGNKSSTVVFVDSNSVNAEGQPLKVPTKRVKGTSARISTAFFAPPKQKRIVWRNRK